MLFNNTDIFEIMAVSIENNSFYSWMIGQESRDIVLLWVADIFISGTPSIFLATSHGVP